jgi:predicted GNAT superfamily acetyltransferase
MRLTPEKLSGPSAWRIQPLADAHRSAVLRLNAVHYPAVYTLDETTLHEMRACSGGFHRVVLNETGVLCGYLLSFSRASDYDDTEISELRRLVAESFVYICQVVVAPGHRNRGIARALYDELAKSARSQDVRWLCCDVNTNPPNPDSFAFHQRMGFREIGRGTASNGFAIAYLAREL